MCNYVLGVHHISINVDNIQQMQTVKEFYVGLLGMSLVSETESCMMISAGNCLLEVFPNGGTRELGAIRHFALEVTDTAALVDRVRKAGYTIKMEVTRIDYPAIIAFCIGPVNEQIEFFQLKNLD